MDLAPFDTIEKRRYCMRHFIIVCCTISPATATTKPVRFTKRFGVVCKDIERAIHLCKEHYKGSGVEITSIADQGSIDKVDHE